MKHFRIGIIGGGIWGLSTAYHLSRLGHAGDVILLERNPSLATETTPQSAGQIGQLRGDALLARAVGMTLELLSGFQDVTGIDPGFVRSGSLHVALHPRRVTQFRQLKSITAGLGISTEWVDPKDVRTRVAELRPSQVLSALFVPQDGYVDAQQCALAFAEASRQAGVEIACNEEVQRIDDGQTGRLRLTTSNDQFEVERLVVTAGPWTGRLLRQMGIAVAMHPIRLQQGRTVDVGVPAKHPVIRVPDESCYVRPERGGYLFGFFDPNPLPIDLHDMPACFRTSDVQPEPDLVRQAAKRLDPLFERLATLPIDMFRQGMITCTPDGKFIVGPTADDERIWIATGCGGTGIAACGAIGHWLAKWTAEGDPDEDLSAYAMQRFGELAGDSTWLRSRARATAAAYYRLPPDVDSIQPTLDLT